MRLSLVGYGRLTHRSLAWQDMGRIKWALVWINVAGVIWLGMVAHGGAGTYQASRGRGRRRQMAREQPDLVKALLGSRQETALQQLLENSGG